ncbi:MAG: hypothetical protein CME65_08905 [Halobacteriovoraceae bacterium]|nr:hypothetical protein [Halobacteriovoraceae bacterium]
MKKITLNLTNSNPEHAPPEKFVKTLENHFSIHDFNIMTSLENKDLLTDADYILGWALPIVFLKRNLNLKEIFLFSSQVPESYLKLNTTVIDSKGVNSQFVVNYIKEALPSNWSNKNILILGKGHIGSLLDSNLQSKKVRVLTRSPKKPNESNYSHFSREISQADIIIPTLSLSRETSKLFSQEDFFSHLKADVRIINTTRGKLIEEELIYKFFSTHEKAFYHTDVTDPEPYPSQGILRSLKNCTITNHIAGFGEGYWEKLLDRILVKTQDWI